MSSVAPNIIFPDDQGEGTSNNEMSIPMPVVILTPKGMEQPPPLLFFEISKNGVTSKVYLPPMNVPVTQSSGPGNPISRTATHRDVANIPVNVPVTEMNTHVTPMNVPMVPMNAPVTPLNVPVTGLNGYRTPMNATRMNAPVPRCRNLPAIQMNSHVTQLNGQMSSTSPGLNRPGMRIRPVTSRNVPEIQMNGPLIPLNDLAARIMNGLAASTNMPRSRVNDSITPTNGSVAEMNASVPHITTYMNSQATHMNTPSTHAHRDVHRNAHMIQMNGSVPCASASSIQLNGNMNVPVNHTIGPVTQMNALVNHTNGPVTQMNALVNHTNGPVTQVNAPVNRTNGPQSPVTQMYAVVNRNNGPVIPMNAPVNHTNGPATQTNTPVNRTNGCMTQMNALVNCTNGPVAQMNAPANYRNQPVTLRNLPPRQTNENMTHMNAPVNHTNGPVSYTLAPSTQINVAAAQLNAPATQMNVRGTQVNEPVLHVNAPAIHTNDAESHQMNALAPRRARASKSAPAEIILISDDEDEPVIGQHDNEGDEAVEQEQGHEEPINDTMVMQQLCGDEAETVSNEQVNDNTVEDQYGNDAENNITVSDEAQIVITQKENHHETGDIIREIENIIEQLCDNAIDKAQDNATNSSVENMDAIPTASTVITEDLVTENTVVAQHETDTETNFVVTDEAETVITEHQVTDNTVADQHGNDAENNITVADEAQIVITQKENHHETGDIIREIENIIEQLCDNAIDKAQDNATNSSVENMDAIPTASTVITEDLVTENTVVPQHEIDTETNFVVTDEAEPAITEHQVTENTVADQHGNDAENNIMATDEAQIVSTQKQNHQETADIIREIENIIEQHGDNANDKAQDNATNSLVVDMDAIPTVITEHQETDSTVVYQHEIDTETNFVVTDEAEAVITEHQVTENSVVDQHEVATETNFVVADEVETVITHYQINKTVADQHSTETSIALSEETDMIITKEQSHHETEALIRETENKLEQQGDNVRDDYTEMAVENMDVITKYGHQSLVDTSTFLDPKETNNPENYEKETQKAYLHRQKYKSKTARKENFKNHSKEAKPAERNAAVICRVCKKYFRNSYNLKLHCRLTKHTRHHTVKECYKKKVCKRSLTNTTPTKCMSVPVMAVENNDVIKNHNHQSLMDTSIILDPEVTNNPENYEKATRKSFLHQRKYKSKTARKENFKNHNKEDKLSERTAAVICRVCKKYFRNVYNLKLHARLTKHTRHHAAKDYYKQKVCKRSDTNTTPTQCISVFCDSKLYTCRICWKSFALKGNLTQHKRIHADEKPYTCKICGKSFCRNTELKEHSWTHTGKKPYECKICGKGFTRSTSLNTHRLIHTGAKPYKCSNCGKRFARKWDLTTHNWIHTGEKPYQCNTCGKRFAGKGDLTKHNRIHTGEKPYQCKTCGKWFARNGDLTRHNHIHTGEKPYQCSTCGKCFTQNYSLKTHSRTHTSAK